MKRQQVKYGTPKIGTKGISWLFWQRKSQTHAAQRLLYKPEKWGSVWNVEKQIQILQDGIYCFSMALKYKDRGYHKYHRKCRRDAKDMIKNIEAQLARGIG